MLYAIIAALVMLTPAADNALETRAGTLALDTVCSPRRAGNVTRCREVHGDRVRRDAAVIVRLCRAERLLPEPEHCLALVATASGESSLLARPTCGAPDECKADCGADHRCLVRCAIDHGLAGYRLKRVLSCNDGGTSAGWFQIKRRGGVRELCEVEWGRVVDLHDLEDATRCYALAVSRSARANNCRARDPWPSAFARVAGGPWKARLRADGVKRKVRRCGPNGYFDRAEEAWFSPVRTAGDAYPRAVIR